MNKEDAATFRLILGILSWITLISYLGIEVGENWATAFLIITAIIGLIVALPSGPKPGRLQSSQKPPWESGDPREETDNILGAIEHRQSRLEEIRSKHGNDFADRCEEILRQQEFLLSQDGE
jgi:hypothetical protein